jgi:type II secretory pathway pseudopilin PulG
MDLNLIALSVAVVALLVAIVALVLLWLGMSRSKRKLQAMELLLKELLKARDSARKQLNELHSSALGTGQKLGELEKGILTIAERQQELVLRDPDSRLYSRAARMVELGAGLDEVMAECEIPKAEAELLISLRSAKTR